MNVRLEVKAFGKVVEDIFWKARSIDKRATYPSIVILKPQHLRIRIHRYISIPTPRTEAEREDVEGGNVLPCNPDDADDEVRHRCDRVHNLRVRLECVWTNLSWKANAASSQPAPSVIGVRDECRERERDEQHE